MAEKKAEAISLEKILKSSVMFMAYILKVMPTPYQAQLLMDDKKEVIFVGGRQVGKSTVLGVKALYVAFMYGWNVLILSYTLNQARIIYDKIYEWVLNNEFLKRHALKLTMSEIKFDSGGMITIVPAGTSGESARGYSASLLIFDEASLMSDRVFIALLPSLAVKGKQVIYSGTPYGKRGYFFEKYSEYMRNRKAKDRMSMYRIKSSESPFVDKAFLETMKNEMTVLQYKQEFEAEFVDEQNLYYPFELVVKSASDYEYKMPVDAEGRLIMGIDVARLGTDDTAIVIVEEDKEGKRKVVWAETHGGMLVNETAGRVVEIAKSLPKLEKAYVDETGVGGGLVDILKEYLGDIVKGVVFTSANRDRIYSTLKLWLEQSKLVLCGNDRKMLYEFSSFEARYTSNGKLNIIKSVDKHDDLIDALALTFYDTKSINGGGAMVLEEGLGSENVEFGRLVRVEGSRESMFGGGL